MSAPWPSADSAAAARATSVGDDLDRPILGRHQPASEPTRPIRSSARRSSGWKTTTSANSPTTAPVSRIWVSSRSAEQPGREVDDEQDRHADDEANRARAPDEAEQPVDEERRDPDVQDGRQANLIQDRREELRHARRVYRASSAEQPLGRAPRRSARPALRGSGRHRPREGAPTARQWTSASACVSPVSEVSRSSSSIFSVATAVQPRSSWRLAMARWTCGSPGAARAAAGRPRAPRRGGRPSRWTMTAVSIWSRALCTSPASSGSAASASSVSGSGRRALDGCGGGDGRSIAGHSAALALAHGAAVHVDPLGLRAELGDARARGPATPAWRGLVRRGRRPGRRSAPSSASSAPRPDGFGIELGSLRLSPAERGAGAVPGPPAAWRRSRAGRRAPRVPRMGSSRRGAARGLGGLGLAARDVQDEREPLEVRGGAGAQAALVTSACAGAQGRLVVGGHAQRAIERRRRPRPSGRAGAGPCPGSRSAGRARARAAAASR